MGSIPIRAAKRNPPPAKPPPRPGNARGEIRAIPLVKTSPRPIELMRPRRYDWAMNFKTKCRPMLLLAGAGLLLWGSRHEQLRRPVLTGGRVGGIWSRVRNWYRGEF